MSITAVVALLHDLVITLGVYAWFQIDISPNVIAALLTIMGYSLYDTVVEFNRMNENAKQLRDGVHHTYFQICNFSINEVIVRTINTTIVTLVPLGVLGTLGLRHELFELRSHGDGVDHDVLGTTRMDGDPMDEDLRLACVEALVVEVAQRLAVHGIAIGRVQLVEVEELGTVADLLVGNKGQLEHGVRKRGFSARRARSEQISATPDLSSAESSVEPSEQMMS